MKMRPMPGIFKGLCEVVGVMFDPPAVHLRPVGGQGTLRCAARTEQLEFAINHRSDELSACVVTTGTGGSRLVWLRADDPPALLADELYERIALDWPRTLDLLGR